MKELRIKFDDSISDRKAIYLLDEVIRMGKISRYKNKPCYCFASKITLGEKGYNVYYNEKRKTLFFNIQEAKDLELFKEDEK